MPIPNDNVKILGKARVGFVGAHGITQLKHCGKLFDLKDIFFACVLRDGRCWYRDGIISALKSVSCGRTLAGTTILCWKCFRAHGFHW